MSIHQVPERAQAELNLASEYANNASKAWENAGELHKFWSRQSKRLNHWKSIMSTAPVIAMNAAFIPVCVAEYFFSREIYRDISKTSPWAIAIGLIAIGIVISEMIVYLIFKQKRELKFYEMRNQNELKSNTPDDILKRETKAYARQMFIIGMLLGLAILGLIYYFSRERVSRELLAERRTTNFGVQDLMPIGLYLFEIITGCFIWYTLRKTVLWIQIKWAKSQVDKKKSLCFEMTELCAKKYEDAEEMGLKWFEKDSTVNEKIYTCFYRRKEVSSTDDDIFFDEPKETQADISFKVMRSGSPLQCKIDIFSEYKCCHTGTTNIEGVYKFKFESYPNDSVRDIRLTITNSETLQPEVRELHGAYQCNGQEFVIDWG